MSLVTPEPLCMPQVIHLGKHHQISWKITWKPLTNGHHSLQLFVEIPESNGIYSDQTLPTVNSPKKSS